MSIVAMLIPHLQEDFLILFYSSLCISQFKRIQATVIGQR
jgi:hypothetical protein